MTLTVAQARDDMTKMVKDVWPTGKTLVYDDIAGAEIPSADLWGRVTIRHVEGFQSTLSGALGKQRYTRIGVLTVQIFAASGKGLSDADATAKIVLDAFEGKASPGGVWFRNGKVQEVGPDGNFFQMNVTFTFEYDEVK